jgi:hypothetical protein
VGVCEVCKHQFFYNGNYEQKYCDACILEDKVHLLRVRLNKAERKKLQEFVSIMKAKEVYLRTTFNNPLRSESLSDCLRAALIKNKIKV